MSAPAQDGLPERRSLQSTVPRQSTSSPPSAPDLPTVNDTWTAEDIDIPEGLSELFGTLPTPFSSSSSSSRRDHPSTGLSGGATVLPPPSSSIATPATPPEQPFTLDALLGPPVRQQEQQQHPAQQQRTPSQARRTSAWRYSNASSALGMSFPNDRIGHQIQSSSDRDRPRERDEAGWNGLATARAFYDSRPRMGGDQAARLETLTNIIDHYNRHQPGRSSSERMAIRTRLPGPRTDMQGGSNSSLFSSLVRPAPTSSTSAAPPAINGQAGPSSSTNERMATTVLRRRNGDGMRWTNRVAYGFDPADIAPPGGPDDHIWDILGDPDSDDDVWGMYRVDDGEDVDGWGDHPEGGASLSRGRNNRRRSRHEDESMSIDFSPRPTFQPTNNTSDGSPIVVGRRRRRSPGATPKKETNDVASKKRKCTTPTLPRAWPSYLNYTCLPDSSVLPNDFMEPPRDSHLELTYRGDHPVVTFGEQHRERLQDSESDSCALRANCSIPTGIGVHYYEVEVLDAGRLRYVSVGWMSAHSALNRLVGWDKGTWGWHCDDGNSFAGQNHGTEFTEPWGSGDVVGAGIDFSTGRAFFTRNGKLVGSAFAELPQHLYPAVGMRAPRESVAVNFTGPFKYDIDAHVKEIADRVKAKYVPERWTFSGPPVETKIPKLAGLPISAGGDEPDESDSGKRSKRKGKAPVTPVNALPADSPLRDPAFRAETAFVLDHLVQNGHSRVLSLMKSSMAKRGWVPPASSSENDAGEAAARLGEFLSHLREGKVRRDLIPRIEGRLDQRLAVHELAAVIDVDAMAVDPADADEADSKAIELGRALRARVKAESWAPAEEELLGHAVALLAGPSRRATEALAAAREADAEELDRTVRHMLGLKPRSCLSLAIAQMGLIFEVLGSVGDGESPFLGVDTLLPSKNKPL